MSLKIALNKIKKIHEVQKHFNPFISINKEASNQLKLNDGLDREKSIHNLICGIKDNITTKDLPTTCGSKILAGYLSPFDATVVELLKNAGSVIAGKTNLDEFGMGSGGTHSSFGVTYNPLYGDNKVITGGSSSGSAAAVASDVVDFAIGTDTGGSVRLPAAYTSTIGFKPSYGRISRFGVVAYAQSFDTVGILSKDINIIRKVFKILDRYDYKDPTSMTNDLRQYTLNQYTKKDKLKIGIIKELNQNNIPDEITDAMRFMIDKLIEKGHSIYPISFPSIKTSLPIYYTLVPAEAASNLSRYDGIRYGMRDSLIDIADGVLFAPTRDNFGQEIKNRIILGNYNLCSDSFKNNYIKAQKLRVELINQFDSVFSFPNALTNNTPNENGVDIVLSLTSMNLPVSVENFIENDEKDPLNSYVNDIFTIPMSLAGLPTISIPVPGYKSVGLQFFGQYGNDQTVLDIAEMSL